MSKGPNVHVTPNPKGGWNVTPEGQKPVATKPTQGEAIDAGRPIADRNKSDLIIHRPNGQIRDRDSHGNETKKPDKNGKK